MKVKKINPITTVIVLFVILVTVALVLWFISVKYSATINILVAPTESTIKVGDKTLKNGDHKFEPGEYEVNITMDGFNPYSGKITLEAGKVTDLHQYLAPASGDYQWYIDRPKEQAKLTDIADRAAFTKADQLKSEYPIVDRLPYKSGVYTIDYGFDTPGDNQSIYLMISSDYDFYSDGLNKVYELGFDPGDYKIKFDSYNNPFNKVKP
jgi:hypothetical protein